MVSASQIAPVSEKNEDIKVSGLELRQAAIGNAEKFGKAILEVSMPNLAIEASLLRHALDSVPALEAGG